MSVPEKGTIRPKSTVYNRRRYYAREREWFISKDPIELAGGLSVSGFQCVPNPVDRIDPLWLFLNKTV
ncbi:TPA: hypothetical protein QDC22_004998 [Burkholderia stabilis]|nr:hypothetical protein [Burkholderia stabilis]HDR9651115.1 hypothetical protein [Burkholderia stabilis]HDR9656743.1 hypothetical protein [Burkholderia stabilis]HDR9681303.1 hypothetical protein [Burkholderia stabilis]